MKTLALILALILPVAVFSMPPLSEMPDAPLCDAICAIQKASSEAKKIDPHYYCSSVQYTVAYLADKKDKDSIGCPHWRILFSLPKDDLTKGTSKALLILVSADGSVVKVYKNPKEVWYQAGINRKVANHS